MFYGYDMVVDKDGKATGSATRALQTTELPFCMAKSRTYKGEIHVKSESFDAGAEVWKKLFV